MADITMCRGEGCTRREQCYRYTAPINRYGQSVFINTPKEPCSHFWDNAGRRDGREIGMWWKKTEDDDD